MKEQVKTSRKEAKRQKSARERQVYLKHKSASKLLSAIISDFDFILEAPGFWDLTDPKSMIARLITEYREGNGDRGRHDELIFAPDLNDLRNLSIGILDHKELPLPAAFVPETREDTRALCERMIVRSRNQEFIAYVVAGWPGCRASRDEIAKGSRPEQEEAFKFLAWHVDELWRLSGSAPGLFKAIVQGRHRSALNALVRKVPPRTSPASVRALIARQGLIWCANDLQMILARSALGAANPFGLLVSSDQVQMKPERIANDLKARLVLLRLVLQLYATTAEENDNVDPKPLSEVPDDPYAELLVRRIVGIAGRQGVDLLALRPRLDALIVKIRQMKIHGDPTFWELLEKPITANELQAHFSGMWFSGLTHVEVAAVTVLRYLQAEVLMEQLVAERCGIPGIAPPPRADPPMPPFRERDLPQRSSVHAKNLLFLYRREILQDKQAPEPDVPLSHRSKNAGSRPIDKAKKFLRARGQRALGDDKGDINSPKRTFYLIDVIPEARLLR